MKNKFDNDHNFDKAARNAFENFELPFDNKDWEAFQADYEEEKKKTKLFPIRSILSFKGVSLALIISVSACVLAYGINSYHNYIISNNAIKTGNTTTTRTNILNSTTNSDNSATEENSQNKEKAIHENNIFAETSSLESVNNSYNTAIIENKNQTESAKEKNIKTKPNSLSHNSIIYKNNTNKNSKEDYTTITANQSLKNDIAYNTEEKNSTSKILDELANTANNANVKTSEQEPYTIAAADKTTIHTNNETIILPAWELQTNTLDKKKKTNPDFELKKSEPLEDFVRKMRLGMLVGVENQARNHYGKSAASFTLGVLGEITFSKLLSLQVGLNFSLRKYEQSYLLSGDDLSSSSFISEVSEIRKTHLRLVQIPIHLQWDVFTNKQWRIYLQTGVNTYFNVSQHYSGTRETSYDNIRFSSNINRTDYPGAILQEKSFKNNIFFTGQFGLGIERKLSEEWSLFVQPHMQYSINAMNRFGDKGYTLALHVGAKTTLK